MGHGDLRAAWSTAVAGRIDNQAGRRVLALAGMALLSAFVGCLVATTAMAGTQGALALLAVVAALAIVPTLLAARQPWVFSVVLSGLVLGTMIGDKGFAYQGLQLGSVPLYVTDLALGALLVVAALHNGLAATLRPALGALAPYAPFLAWGTFLLVQAVPRYDIDAVKDFAIFYYLLFVPVGYVAARAGGRPGALVVAALLAGCSWIIGKAFVISLQGGGESLSFGVGYADTRPIFGWSGLYVTAGILLVLALLGAVPRRWRPAALLLVAGGAACVYLGQQRSVWIALAAGALVLLLVHPSWRPRLPRLCLAAIPMAGLGAVVLLQLAQLPGHPLPAGIDRFTAGVLAPDRDPTAAWRLAAWSTALDLVESEPMTGTGLGTPFTWSVGGFQVENRPHNTFLTVAVKSGVPGLLLLAVPLGWLYVAAVRTCLDVAVPLPARHRLAGLLAAHAALTTYGGFNLLLESPYVAWPYWVLTGAMLAVRHDGLAQAARGAR